MSHLLQVGLLYGTFPSGSLVVLVGDKSEIGLGLLKRLLFVGLLSRGGGGKDVHRSKKLLSFGFLATRTEGGRMLELGPLGALPLGRHSQSVGRCRTK